MIKVKIDGIVSLVPKNMLCLLEDIDYEIIED
jgi:hypothetical protein